LPVPRLVSKDGREGENGRTKFAVAQLEDVFPDGVEELLPLLLRRAPHPLLKEEAALLVVVDEDAADEGLSLGESVGKDSEGQRRSAETDLIVDFAIGVEEETVVDLLDVTVRTTRSDRRTARGVGGGGGRGTVGRDDAERGGTVMKVVLRVESKDVLCSAALKDGEALEKGRRTLPPLPPDPPLPLPLAPPLLDSSELILLPSCLKPPCSIACRSACSATMPLFLPAPPPPPAAGKGRF
jgi:hypothetical protein